MVVPKRPGASLPCAGGPRSTAPRAAADPRPPRSTSPARVAPLATALRLLPRAEAEEGGRRRKKEKEEEGGRRRGGSRGGKKKKVRRPKSRPVPGCRLLHVPIPRPPPAPPRLAPASGHPACPFPDPVRVFVAVKLCCQIRTTTRCAYPFLSLTDVRNPTLSQFAMSIRI